MRLIKMLGLAVLVALAAIAISGMTATVSQATTVLCSEDVTPCPGGKIIGNGVSIVGGVIAPVQSTFKAEKSNQEALPNVTCQTSAIAGTVTGNDETQVLAEVTTLNFSQCTAGKLFNCTVETLQLNYSASDIYTEQGRGTFTLFAKAPNAQPGALVDCPIVGLKCVYKVAEANNQSGLQAGNLTLTGGNPAVFEAAQVTLKTTTPSGGNCLTIKFARWDAVYTVSSPKPLFQSKDQP